MASGHTWKFFRAGGFDQVRLDTGSDLMAIDELDQKLWVALACPTTGIDFDAETLSLIDTDKDGRIRAPELIAAVKWAAARLKNPDDLLKCAPELALSAINESTPEGKEVLASARQILKDKAVFQAGTLYLDQRSCDLCLKVEDPAKHAVMAGRSGTYLAYCDCARRGSGEQMQRLRLPASAHCRPAPIAT
jgi:hypothetical protein